MPHPSGRLLVRGGTLVTVDAQRRVIDDGAVLVEGSLIREVGPAEELDRRHPGVKRIDARDGLILPGLINTHTHLFQGLLKGLGDDRPLSRWLSEMTAPAGAQLTEEHCAAAAQLGAAEAIRSGCTTIVDFMYVHPRPGLIEALAQGLAGTGLRALLARGFVTRGVELGVPQNLIEPIDQVLADCQALRARYGDPDGLIQTGIAPALLWMVAESDLVATRDFVASHSGLITYHMAETGFEVAYAQDTYRRPESEVLRRAGLLGPDLLAVHCTKLTSRDIQTLRAFDVKVSHNPVSNMYLASGVAPIPELLSAGVTVGLATDGPGSNNNQNMLHVLKAAALLHKVHHEDATVMTAEKVIEMATIGGARAIGMEDRIGSLEPGKRADLVVLALDNPHVAPVHDPISAVVYAALGSEPRTVLIDGHVVMRDGELTTLNEPAVIERATRAAHDLAQRAGLRHRASGWGHPRLSHY